MIKLTFIDGGGDIYVNPDHVIDAQAVTVDVKSSVVEGAMEKEATVLTMTAQEITASPEGVRLRNKEIVVLETPEEYVRLRDEYYAPKKAG